MTLRIAIHRTHNFLRTTYAWISQGGEPVATKEAIRRSEICVKCPFNMVDGVRGPCPECFARKAVLTLFGYREPKKDGKVIDGMLPFHDNPHNDALTYCGKCGCDLKLKVFIPLGVIENEGVDYPPHCWQVKDAPVETDGPMLGIS